MSPTRVPLIDCFICISGKFPDQTQGEVKQFLKEIGASVTTTISQKTTHLVTTAEDFPDSAKARQAEARGDCHIVSLEWAQECERQGIKIDEAKFAIGAAAKPAATTNGSKSKAKSTAAASKAQPKTNSKANSKAASKSSSRKRSAPDGSDSDGGDDKDVKDRVDAKKRQKNASSDEQVAASNDVAIPLDEGVPLQGAKVYIDDTGLIYDAALNQTNSSNNNNKFYRIQLLQQASRYTTWTRWGRVGEFGQSALLGGGGLDNAIQHFEKKFKDKSGHRWADRMADPKPGKYAFIAKSYGPDSDDDDDDEEEDADAAEAKNGKAVDYIPPKSELEPAVLQLMELIFSQANFDAAMRGLNYDANKLPLGKLAKSNIAKGFKALSDLADLFDDPSQALAIYGISSPQAVENLSNLFYTLIPHDFGRQRPPIIQTMAVLKQELDLLESLSDMKDANDIMRGSRGKEAQSDVHPLDRHFQGLDMDEMTPLDPNGAEFQQLSDYLNGTRGDTHYVQYREVEQIFRIQRRSEADRFDSYQLPGSAKSDRRLLWHGSRATNFGGILSQGLRIAPPEAPVSGYMFGKGIYLADMSTKSAGYCYPYCSNNTALLLLCEAELGTPMLQLVDADSNAGEAAQKKGSASTWGQGITGPKQWKDAGCIHPSLKGVKMPSPKSKPGDTGVKDAYLLYNEYIAYDVAQVQLRYLFRVKT